MSDSGVVRYGYDHCRVCGKPITVLRPGSLGKWEQAQRKPLMPEKQWRDMGFLAAPTQMQINSVPADGCCGDCGLKLTKRKWRYHERGALLIVVAVTICWVIFWIISYMRH
jgi:predicted nucleic acid-binding Zn ribbon protein